MATKSDSNGRCFLAVPFAPKFDVVRSLVQDAADRAGFEVVSLESHLGRGSVFERRIFAEIARSDCVIADVSHGNTNVFFQIGQAYAMSKATILLINENELDSSRLENPNLHLIGYNTDRDSLSRLHRRLERELNLIRRGARRGRTLGSGVVSVPFFVDWDRLQYEDTENLCRELLMQMGYRRVEWNKASREFDITAELPKKDPDGFEYTELWLVSLGRFAPADTILDIVESDPEYLIHRLIRSELVDEQRVSDRGVDMQLTLLFVLLHEGVTPREIRRLAERVSIRERKRPFPPNLRIRIWDRDYVTGLVHQFPQLGFKYFSDEARSLSKYRKGPEELYHENVVLIERLSESNAKLEAERNLRIRAERDSVWKDISFAAAHKIGNPIFAIETDLDPLRKRIFEDRKEEAIDVTNNMQSAVEKAKAIVDQFKSLTKAQQVKPIAMAIRPLLDSICRTLRGLGAKCAIDCNPKTTITADPERIQEVLDELGMNAMHWIGKEQLNVTIEAKPVSKDELPSTVDSNRQYVLIHFKDNGLGVDQELKERIFEAFFTTYDQGTGLGLALVRRIVEGHGGVVREVGQPGKGADFEIYLPMDEISANGSNAAKT